MGAAHTSAADLNDGLSGVDMGGGERNSRMAKVRGSSTNGKRARPMTAKVNKGGLY